MGTAVITGGGFNVYDVAASGPAPPPLPTIPVAESQGQPFSLQAARGMAYCSADDRLFFQWTDPADQEPVFRITARVVLPDGSISVFVNTQKALGEIQTARVTWPLPEGIVISCTVEVLTGFNSIGFWYVTAGIFYGNDSTGSVAQTLVSGYPAKDTILSWPRGPQMQPGEGSSGRIQFGPVGNNPSPLFTSPFPRSSKVFINFAQARIVTNAVAGNRTIMFYIGDGAGNYNGPGFVANTLVPASSSVFFIWTDSAEEKSQAGFVNVPIARKIPVFPTTTAAVQIIGGDPGDRIQNLLVDFEFWAGFNNP